METKRAKNVKSTWTDENLLSPGPEGFREDLKRIPWERVRGGGKEPQKKKAKKEWERMQGNLVTNTKRGL